MASSSTPSCPPVMSSARSSESRPGRNEPAKAWLRSTLVGRWSSRLTPTPTTAKDRSRRFIGLYLALFPNIAQETQLPDDLIQQVRAAFNQGGPEAAAAYIDDEVVEYLTASGTPAECRRKIETYRAAGVQHADPLSVGPKCANGHRNLGATAINIGRLGAVPALLRLGPTARAGESTPSSSTEACIASPGVEQVRGTKTRRHA